VTGRGQAPEERRYALELDEREVERYRLMADQARADEADLWELAGIGPGARVADVGCGPGAMLPALSAAVGPRAGSSPSAAARSERPYNRRNSPADRRPPCPTTTP
jgi:hypothetical protein